MIDIKQLHDAMERLVVEKGPEFRYRRPDGPPAKCHYRPRPDLYPVEDPRHSSGCIVGEAVKAIDLKAYAVIEARTNPAVTYGPDVEDWPTFFTQAAADFAQIVQEAQDAGDTWANALASGAEIFAKELAA